MLGINELDICQTLSTKYREMMDWIGKKQPEGNSEPVEAATHVTGKNHARTPDELQQSEI